MQIEERVSADIVVPTVTGEITVFDTCDTGAAALASFSSTSV
jgi:hypothetical protein